MGKNITTLSQLYRKLPELNANATGKLEPSAEYFNSSFLTDTTANTRKRFISALSKALDAFEKSENYSKPSSEDWQVMDRIYRKYRLEVQKAMAHGSYFVQDRRFYDDVKPVFDKWLSDEQKFCIELNSIIEKIDTDKELRDLLETKPKIFAFLMKHRDEIIAMKEADMSIKVVFQTEFLRDLKPILPDFFELMKNGIKKGNTHSQVARAMAGCTLASRIHQGNTTTKACSSTVPAVRAGQSTGYGGGYGKQRQ